MEIAKAVGRGAKTISAWRERQGLRANDRRSRRKYDYGLARELYEQRKSDEEIAAVLGCSKSTIRDWRYQEGLSAWPREERER